VNLDTKILFFNSWIIYIAIPYRKSITRGLCTAMKKLKKQVNMRNLELLQNDH